MDGSFMHRLFELWFFALLIRVDLFPGIPVVFFMDGFLMHPLRELTCSGEFQWFFMDASFMHRLFELTCSGEFQWCFFNGWIFHASPFRSR